MFEIWGLVLIVIGCVEGEQVCYDHLGCFSNKDPWGGTLYRPIASLPDAPDHINTRFLLFTKDNPDNFQAILASNPNSTGSSAFKASRKSRFIIHGFIENGDDIWLTTMCKTMLQVEDVNCFCVDWSGGSHTSYPQAVNNIRIVGAELARFIGFLKSNFQYSLSNIHIIGHSLGSHAAGEAGKRMPGIARITGLDPAGPFFHGTPEEVRLDPSDGVLVDVIHTDMSPLIPMTGFGIDQPSGHLDFYPNGGSNMPGCSAISAFKLWEIDQLVEGPKEIIFCSHHRSFKYYTESIVNADGFIGYPSPSYKAFTNGIGLPCPSTTCPLMGHYVDTYPGNTSSSQSFYLNTGEESPFSRWRYRVTVQTAGQRTFLGSIHVSFDGMRENTKMHKIASGFITPGKTYVGYIDIEVNAGPLTTVNFMWSKSIIDLIPLKFGAQTIVGEKGKNGLTFKFCSTELVKADTVQTLPPCVIETK